MRKMFRLTSELALYSYSPYWVKIQEVCNECVDEKEQKRTN